MTIRTPNNTPSSAPIQNTNKNRSNPHAPVRDDGPRLNEQIRLLEVRLIDKDGEMVGVVAIKDARKMADDAGLDLVEISPNAEPPVCKVMDYSKYKYEQQKKAAEARKKQKVIEVKEVKIRPNTEEHDYQVKFKAAKRFLEEGNKVKISIRFRGREVTHKEIGEAMMHRLRDDLAEFSKVDLSPKMEGRQMLMILSSSVVKP